MVVLACQAVRLLRSQLALSGPHDGETTIRLKLAHRDRVTTWVQTVDGRVMENRQDTSPEQEVAGIASAADEEPQVYPQQV